MHRREWLKQLCAMGSIPTLLGGVSALALPNRSAYASATPPRRLLTVYNAGGWDSSFVFDPHPQSRQISQPPNSSLRTIGGVSFMESEDRPAVSSFFTQYAQQLCVVNGIAVGSISHSKCEQMFFTGTRFANSPDYASIIAYHKSARTPLPYVILSGPRLTGDLGQYVVTVDSLFSSVIRQENTTVSLPKSDIANFLREQAQNQSTEQDPQYHDHVLEYLESLERRQTLQNYVSQLHVSGNLNNTEQIQLAATLFAQDICDNALIRLQTPPLQFWDSHNSNDVQQNACFQNLFTELSSLLEHLASTRDQNNQSLLETTTIMVVSEMGRTPIYNSAQGKDHWPYTSMLLMGAGVRGGQVIGATNDSMLGIPVDMQSGQAHSTGHALGAGNIVAGLLQSFGIDSTEYLDDTPFSAAFL